MRGIVLLTALFCGFKAMATTEYSKHVDWLQKTFGNANPKQAIVYLDRDRLNREIAGLKDSSNEKKIAVIQAFAKERASIDVDDVNADTMLDYLMLGGNVALPLELKSGQRVCAIVPSNPNLNAYQESNRLLHWKYLKDKPEFQNLRVRETLTKNELMLAADLHETFHCLDNTHMEHRDTFGTDGADFHKAEAFAEAGALLYMAKLGYTDVADSRALFRLVGSYMQTKYKEEFGVNLDQNQIAWGAVYSFHDVIYAVGDFVKEYASAKSFELGQIKILAEEFVSKYGLSDTEFYTIRMHQEHPEMLLQLIADFKKEENEGLRLRYIQVEKDLANYVEQLDQAFLLLLEEVRGESSSPTQDVVKFDPTIHCPQVTDLDNWLDQTRKEHYMAEQYYSPEVSAMLENIYLCGLNSTN